MSILVVKEGVKKKGWGVSVCVSGAKKALARENFAVFRGVFSGFVSMSVSMTNPLIKTTAVCQFDTLKRTNVCQ